MRKNRFLGLLQGCKPDVDRALAQILQRQLDKHGPAGAEVSRMLEVTEALTLRGGKRLRAGLIHAGYLAVAQRRGQKARLRRCSVAIELLQSYFLIHDDWMDQDEIRRGGPSVHAALATHFRSRHLGACAGILAGDYLVALASREFGRAASDHPRCAQLLTLFAELQMAAVVGQQLDAMAQSEDPLQVYQFKTGSYTVSGPLLLGAQLAEAAPTQLRALDRFAQPAGVAFQLRDDLLSLFQPAQSTGKPFANDLKSGKQTWLIRQAFALANREQKRRIRLVFGDAQARRPQLRDAVEAVEECGAREATELLITDQRKKALSALNSAKLNASGQALLSDALSALLDREF